MRKIILFIIIAATSFTLTYAQTEEITNDNIISLLQQGQTSEQIISTIEKNPKRSIKYSLGYIRQLKQAGADETLTTYIQKICKSDNTYQGFYWWNNESKPSSIGYTAFKKKKEHFSLTKLAAATITGTMPLYVAQKAIKGAQSLKKDKAVPPMISSEKDFEKIYMPGKTSTNIVASYTPVFRIYLPGHDQEKFKENDEQEWYKIVMSEIENADEFQLVKIRKKGKNRIFEKHCDWEMGGFEGEHRKHSFVQDLEITQINDNTFELRPKKPLTRGEYVFFWKNCLTSSVFSHHVFGFDFTVPKLKKVKVKKK